MVAVVALLGAGFGLGLAAAVAALIPRSPTTPALPSSRPWPRVASWQLASHRVTTLTVVFGANLDAPFTTCPTCTSHQLGQRAEPCGCDGAPWIVCPTCGGRCDVELPTY